MCILHLSNVYFLNQHVIFECKNIECGIKTRPDSSYSKNKTQTQKKIETEKNCVYNVATLTSFSEHCDAKR